MELVIIMLASACGLGLLAARFGHDSRGRPHSSEEDAAARGFTWDARP